MVNSLHILCCFLDTKLQCDGMIVKGMPDILNASKITKNFEHDLKSHAHTHTHTHTHAVKYFFCTVTSSGELTV